MGIYVSLDIFPDRIDADAWQTYYEDTLRFLRAFPGTVIDLRQETVGRFKRYVYTRAIERDADDPAQRRWRIVGTLDGLKTAEDFTLSADLEVYRRHGKDSTGAQILDTVTAGRARGAQPVFNAKTQGEPYHFALLAIATLAEWRFPGSALASGTIDGGQAEQACADLRDVLGETGPPPLLTDPQRLYATILTSGQGVAAIDRFVEAYREELGESLIALTAYADPDCLKAWFEQQLAGYRPDQLGVQWLYSDWLNATRDLESLGRMACLNAKGPRFAPIDFVKGLAATGVTLTPEEGARMAILKKERGGAGSVAYQFGTALLDASGLQARRSTCFLGEAVVRERLDRLFPEQSAALAGALRERTETLREQMSAVTEAFKRMSQQVADDPESGDAASLLDYTPGAPLSEMQTLILDTFADGIRDGIAMIQREIYTKLPAGMGPREMLAGLCDKYSIVLSEDAWAWIDAEPDSEIIDLLVLIASIRDQSQAFSNLRQALMTHRELCVDLKERAKKTG